MSGRNLVRGLRDTGELEDAMRRPVSPLRQAAAVVLIAAIAGALIAVAAVFVVPHLPEAGKLFQRPAPPPNYVIKPGA